MAKYTLPKPNPIGGNRVNTSKQTTRLEKALKNGPIKSAITRTK